MTSCIPLGNCALLRSEQTTMANGVVRSMVMDSEVANLDDGSWKRANMHMKLHLTTRGRCTMSAVAQHPMLVLVFVPKSHIEVMLLDDALAASKASFQLRMAVERGVGGKLSSPCVH